jgi:hypothetical protein
MMTCVTIGVVINVEQEDYNLNRSTVTEAGNIVVMTGAALQHRSSEKVITIHYSLSITQ